MLARAHRMTRAQDFATAIRRGRRAGTRSVVVHLHCPDGTVTPPRVGLAVGRTVGGSVVRHRVARRLRPLLAARLSRLPAGSLVVVRALPPAAAADSATLADDLDRALDRLLDRYPGGAARRPDGAADRSGAVTPSRVPLPRPEVTV